MKLTSALLPLLSLTLGVALQALAPAVHAQVAGAPAYVDYQGTAYKSTGEPLGSTGTAPNFTAAPTNYTMQFKIWDAQTGGNLIYAETQTVTASLGAFSVRLGSGAPIAGLSPAPAQASIVNAFGGKDRYLELTVVVPPAATGTPIVPRLAFQTSPFSFVAQRAVQADTVNAGNVSAGTLPDARLSANVALRSGGNTFTGPQVIQATAGAAASAANVPLRIVGAGPFYTETGSATLPTGQNLLGFYSMLAENNIKAAGFVAASDARIKNIADRSSIEQDLATVLRLQVTDYRMVDKLGLGDGLRKGFIAQEVEQVIPEAVSAQAGFVPDVYARAAAVKWSAADQTLTLTMPRAHGLKAGDVVRLHADASMLELAVAKVPSPEEVVFGKCDHEVGKVFVYGKQVPDFRAVDYDRIFTTGIGAIQQIKKEKDAEVAALRQENSALKTRLEALEDREKTREAKLVAIEKLLQAAPTPAARLVSLTPGETRSEQVK